MDAWLERLRQEIAGATTGLDDAAWRRAPQGRWNSAQIVEHLGRSYGTTAKMLEVSLASGGPPDIRPAKLQEKLLRGLIVTLGVFPTGAKAPAMVMPTGQDGPAALKRALENLERMDIALATAEQRWGTGAVAMHFRLGPMKAEEWRKFHYVHGCNHVKQMRKRLGRAKPQ
jgi:hypothetical protein